MQEAVPPGEGAMMAILGMTIDEVEKEINVLSKEESCEIANDNSNGQVVVSGKKIAIENFNKKLKDKKKRGIILPVSAPFHSALMKPAEIKLQKELETTEFYDLSFPVINNIEAKPILKGSDARESLIKQVCSPVRWSETMQCIVEKGIESVVELGSGKVLSGLMKRYNKNINCYQVGDTDTLSKTIIALK